MPTFTRRRLPHLHALDCPVFVTWRLHDSLPRGRVFPDAAISGQAFVAMDRILDRATTGPRHLGQPRIAAIMVEALHHAQEQMNYYDLHAYVVMANHVHLLLTPRVEVSRLTHTLKGFTARRANEILGLTGQTFWQAESYDRVVRGNDEFDRIASYIEKNPVRAGLVEEPGAYEWSSASEVG